MATQTLHSEKTTAREIGGTFYVRIPPSFYKYLETKLENQNMTIGMAKGKHGKFLWIQPEVKE